MADIILSRLEEKVQLLVKKVQFLQEENKRLEQGMAQKSEELRLQQEKMQELEQQLTTQRIAATTISEGDQTNSRRGDLKRALNKYIKEIDHCLAQLNE